MSYTRNIREKKFLNGRLLAGIFHAGGSISLVGSVALPHSSSEEELADVHAQMLLEGTKKFDKRALQTTLDAMGASLTFASATNRLQFSARVRTAHFEHLLSLITEILLHPSFPKFELATLKKREEADLALQSQDTYAQASIALIRLLYPKGHPNFGQTTEELSTSLKKINTKTLERFHKRLSADTLVFSVAGDIPPAKVFMFAQKYFVQLPHTKIRLQKILTAQAPRTKKSTVAIKHKASIDYMAGSTTRITNEHADYPALILGLQVLGNRRGFTGRLMQTVREQEGLTYGVYSYPSGFSATADGHTLIWATFAPQLFNKGRHAIMREIKKIVQEGIGTDEVRKHAQLYEARSRVSLSNSGTLARAAHEIVVDGKKLSYLDELPKKVLKLEAKEVNKVLKKYLRPELLSEVAAGPVEKNAFKS